MSLRQQAAFLGGVGIAASVAVLVARRTWTTIAVEGDSMYPTLQDRQVVLARRLGRHHQINRGDIVVVSELGTHRSQAIKRVRGLPGDHPEGAHEAIPSDHLWLVGDGLSSYDSRSAGPVPRSFVVARVSEPRVSKAKSAKVSGGIDS